MAMNFTGPVAEKWGWSKLEQVVKVCTFIEHAFCVSTHFTAFNQMNCNCTDECDFGNYQLTVWLN